MSNKPELLSVESVRVQFPDGTVGLSSASFSAQQGEIIAIIGRSGAGKSTLLRCLNGFQEITSGEIYVSGESVHSMGNTELRRLRRQIGFIGGRAASARRSVARVLLDC